MAMSVARNLKIQKGARMNTTAHKSSTDRSRRFRKTVAELGYRRLEITVGISSIEQLRTLAMAMKITAAQTIELAVDLLAQQHKAPVAGNAKMLKDAEI